MSLTNIAQKSRLEKAQALVRLRQELWREVARLHQMRSVLAIVPPGSIDEMGARRRIWDQERLIGRLKTQYLQVARW